MRSCAIFSDKGCVAIAMNFIKALPDYNNCIYTSIPGKVGYDLYNG